MTNISGLRREKKTFINFKHIICLNKKKYFYYLGSSFRKRNIYIINGHVGDSGTVANLGRFAKGINIY